MIQHAVPKTLHHYTSLMSRVSPECVKIEIGFVDNMRVPGYVYVTDNLMEPLMEELKGWINSEGKTFLPALIQLANSSSLPAIVNHSVAMPDIHAGYGFPIGGVAAFDIDNLECPICPGILKFSIFRCYRIRYQLRYTSYSYKLNTPRCQGQVG